MAVANRNILWLILKRSILEGGRFYPPFKTSSRLQCQACISMAEQISRSTSCFHDISFVLSQYYQPDCHVCVITAEDYRTKTSTSDSYMRKITEYKQTTLHSMKNLLQNFSPSQNLERAHQGGSNSKRKYEFQARFPFLWIKAFLSLLNKGNLT